MTWVPPPAAAAAAARARAVLADAGYTPEAVHALRRSGAFVPERAARRALAADASPAAVLMRLFLVGDAVPRNEAEGALGEGLDSLAALDLLRADGELVTATVEIVPHDELVIASDRRDLAEQADVVPGLHAPSATLGTLTVRRPVRRALDVGTGNGIQAILISPFAEHVVATDVNERALAFAQLNCALNGRENVELRLGSFLEPVAGERFGLIVANPPYVISPESRYVFRDSGLGGDRVSAELVRNLPAHLEPGGHASVMISWIQEGDVIGPRVQSWVDGTGADGLLLHAAVTAAKSAASQWNRDLAADENRYDAAVDEWNAYFRAEGIEAIGYGTLVLRRSDAAEPWFSVLALSSHLGGQASEQLFRLFEATDAAQLDDETLLDLRIVPVPAARLTQILEPTGGAWREAGTDLTVADSIELKAHVDETTRRILLSLDGNATIGEVLAGAAVEAGAAPTEAAQALPLVRRLLTAGYLMPAGAELTQ
jgi:methylase of polypeptide subunit release factors